MNPLGVLAPRNLVFLQPEALKERRKRCRFVSAARDSALFDTAYPVKMPYGTTTGTRCGRSMLARITAQTEPSPSRRGSDSQIRHKFPSWNAPTVLDPFGVDRAQLRPRLEANPRLRSYREFAEPISSLKECRRTQHHGEAVPGANSRGYCPGLFVVRLLSAKQEAWECCALGRIPDFPGRSVAHLCDSLQNCPLPYLAPYR